MPVATDKIAIVIPTIGRCDELRKMLQSLSQQTRLPDQVVIVDEAGEGHRLADEFLQLKVCVTTFPGGSASAKRNRGARCAVPETGLIGFMDDDIVLEPGAIAAMLGFWRNAPADVAGASCNWMNQPSLFASRLKSMRLVSKLALYNSQGGVVVKSGFHSVIGVVTETRYVQWLPSGAVVYPRRILEKHSLDEWYSGYSYLEDLDFSYNLGKKYKLAVVADARFHHYPSSVGRVQPFAFGKMEVANRFHFVRKHSELSPALCFLALTMRFLFSIFLGMTKLEAPYFKRAWGNVIGFISLVKHGFEPGR